jgi:hypothetical protein
MLIAYLVHESILVTLEHILRQYRSTGKADIRQGRTEEPHEMKRCVLYARNTDARTNREESQVCG